VAQKTLNDPLQNNWNSKSFWLFKEETAQGVVALWLQHGFLFMKQRIALKFTQAMSL
jgi:hypothetical protein